MDYYSQHQQMIITWSSSSSLVCRNMSSCEALEGDLVSDSRCHCLRSSLASLTAAFNLSSERTEKWMELWRFPTFSSGLGSSRSINTGWVTLGWSCQCLRWTILSKPAQEPSESVGLSLSTFSITMGAGKRTLAVRFLGFAGMASLNNSCWWWGNRNVYHLHSFATLNHLLKLKAVD